MKSGGANVYSNVYFTAEGIEGFIKEPTLGVTRKEQDYAIYREIQIIAGTREEQALIPMLAIEIKTYLDKTMLDSAIALAEHLKSGNPYCRFSIVSECYDVDLKVDPVFSRIDQIYVLRKGHSETHANEPIDPEIVISLYRETIKHLDRPWFNVKAKLSSDGKIM